MSTFTRRFMVAIAMAALFFGSVRYVQAGVLENHRNAGCRDLPVVKNLTGLAAEHVCDWMAAPKEMTKGEVKKLAVTANSPEDHLTVARFYRTEANGLDAKAAGYEEAAVTLRNAPFVKNLSAPATPARYEFAAQGFREEAKVDLALAASHEKMARTAVASVK